MNQVLLTGRLAKQPVLRKTTSGTSVASFTLACARYPKQEGQQTTDFIDCIAWGVIADNVNKSLRKGSQALVRGRLQKRSYDDKSGKKVYITEVVVDMVEFLDRKELNSNEMEPTQGDMYDMPQNDTSYDMPYLDLPY